MGVFQRMKLILSSNINHLISKAENPEKILEQLIIDMREQLQEAKKEVAVTIADEKRLARQLQGERDKAAEWEKKAMLAVRGGRDDLARKALSRKAEHDQIAEGYQQSHDQQKTAADNLRTALRQLQEKIEEAQRKKNMLIARAKRAKAQQKIHDTMSGLSDTSAFDSFDRMTSKVEEIEAHAEASAEMAKDSGFGGTSLDDEFAALESESGGDAALADLKAKMGIAAGPPADDDIEAQLAAMKAKSE